MQVVAVVVVVVRPASVSVSASAVLEMERIKALASSKSSTKSTCLCLVFSRSTLGLLVGCGRSINGGSIRDEHLCVDTHTRTNNAVGIHLQALLTISNLDGLILADSR